MLLLESCKKLQPVQPNDKSTHRLMNWMRPQWRRPLLGLRRIVGPGSGLVQPRGDNQQLCHWIWWHLEKLKHSRGGGRQTTGRRKGRKTPFHLPKVSRRLLACGNFAGEKRERGNSRLVDYVIPLRRIET